MPFHAVRGTRTEGKSPSVSLRWLTLLCVPGLLLLGAGRLSAAEPEEEPGFAVAKPEQPGDPFTLRYRVPKGLQTGVLFTCRPPQEDASQATAAPAAASVLVPLAVDATTGLAGLDGVADLVAARSLNQETLEMRIVLHDPISGETSISDVVQLGGGAEADDVEATSATSAPQGPATAGLKEDGKAADGENDGGIQAATSEEDGKEGVHGISAWFGVAIGQITTDSSDVLSLRPFFGTNLLASIHDQPTPVQGSGH